MRTKKSFKYQFQEVWQSIGMLYLVQIGMRLLALLIASKIGGEYVTMNGMNMMSAMFMLIIGMCSFTESRFWQERCLSSQPVPGCVEWLTPCLLQ